MQRGEKIAFEILSATFNFGPRILPMKIALLHTRLLRKGGLETRLFSYLEYLHAAGHSVTVVVGKVGKDARVPDGVRVVRLPMWWVPSTWLHPVFDYFLGRVVARGNFDFVLSLTKSTHQDAILAAGNHPGFLRSRPDRRVRRKDRIMIEMERRGFNHTPHVLACSQMMKDELVEFFGTPAENIEVLLPPTDTRRFNPGLKSRREEFRKKFGLDPAKKSFAFVSVSHKRKGLPLLLEVFRGLTHQPVELVIAGSPPEKKLPPNVKYLGFVREVEELYAAADVTVHPAGYEPYGQIISESILCGTPVLISHMVGAKDVVSAREGLVVQGFDVAEWAAAVMKMATGEFDIPADFAGRHGLRLEDHMARILAIAEKTNV